MTENHKFLSSRLAGIERAVDDTSEIARKLAPRGSRNASTSSEDATLYEKINERVTHMLKYELGPLTIIKSRKKGKRPERLDYFFQITLRVYGKVALFVYISVLYIFFLLLLAEITASTLDAGV